MAGLLLLTGCNNAKQIAVQVEGKQLTGYFVRNDVADSTALMRKMTSKEEFDTYFGAAATMSQLPTEIDFTKEYVAAVLLPKTDRATEITVDSLEWNGKLLTLYYTIQTGDPLSYTLRPMAAVAIDRQYDGEIAFQMNASAERSGSNTISIDVKEGQATTAVEKKAGESVVFTFNDSAPAKLSGTLDSADSLANIRFAQIILPDGTADGPFGPEIAYDLRQPGTYQLIANENIMAGDPWGGEFVIRIALTEE